MIPHTARTQRRQRLLTGRTGTLPASSIAALVGSVAAPQAAGQIGAGIVTYNPNPGQHAPGILVAAEYHEGASGADSLNGGQKCLGKDGFTRRISDGAGVNADINLVVARSLSRLPHQVRLNC